jgi:hypothetical protein
MFADVDHFTDLAGGSGLDLPPELSLFLMGIFLVLVVGGLVWANIWAYQTWAQTEAQREVVYRKRFFCPVKDREVKVGFLAYLWEPENLLGVGECSAFNRGEAMDCNKSCLRLPQAREVRPLFPPPFVLGPFSFL